MSTALLVLVLAQLAPQPGHCMALDYDRMLLRRGDGAVLYGKFDQPLQVREGISDVVAVAMSGNYNIANPIMLRSDGTVWQWSWSGDTHFRLLQVKGVADAVHITQGRDGRSVAVLKDGTARAWKRIGGPATPVAGIRNAVTAAAGHWRVYYLLENGEVVVLGEIWRTRHRQSRLHGLMATLGTGNLEDAVTPQPIKHLGNDNKWLYAVNEFASVITDDDEVWAWGVGQGGRAPHDDYEGGLTYPTNHAVRIPKLGATAARKPVMVVRNLALFDDGSVAGFASSHSDVYPLPQFGNTVAIATNGNDSPTFALLRADGALLLYDRKHKEPQVTAELGAATAADCAMTAGRAGGQ